MRGVTLISEFMQVHTADDLDLVQEVKTIGSPKIQSYLVSVPGRNGCLNLTKALTDNVCYDNRSLTFRYCGVGSRETLADVVETMMSFHGDTLKIIDDDTPDFYYEGEATVEVSYSLNRVIINLKVDALPFKYRLEETNVVQRLSRNENIITLHNIGMSITPKLSVSDSVTIQTRDNTLKLSQGIYTASAVELRHGINKLIVSGSGLLTITYREARL